jgi:hypothetical protein
MEASDENVRKQKICKRKTGCRRNIHKSEIIFNARVNYFESFLKL